MKLRVREKVGFSLGDMAGNFVYQSVVLLLAFYYTDVFGLDPVTVTSIFLFVRIFDALTDPIMGFIVDRTDTRWGKYRPYLLFLSVPYAIISVLVFTVPDFGPEGKTIYAYVTYAALMVFFTATNIPYFALSTVMTQDPAERVSLNSYRFAAATAGGLIVTAGLIPLADYFGGDNKAEGYQQAMVAMAALSVILFFICFVSTKERVKPVAGSKANLKSDLRKILQNDQWRILGLVVFLLVVSQTFKATLAAYYLTYYVEGADGYLSWFLSIWMIGGILGASLTNTVTKFIDKKTAWQALCVISAGLSAIAYVVDADMLTAIFALQFFVGFFNQMMAPLIFSTMADTIDHGELKFERRLDGLTSSFTLFALKLGLAVGGAFATYLLAVIGYESGGVSQSGETVSGILMVFSLVPAVGFICTALVLHRMSLDRKTVTENAEKLEALRAGTAGPQMVAAGEAP